MMVPDNLDNICRVYYEGDLVARGPIEEIGSLLGVYFNTMLGEGQSVYFRFEKPSKNELFFKSIHYGDIYIQWDTKIIVPVKVEKEIIDSEEEQAVTIEIEEQEKPLDQNFVLPIGTMLTNNNFLYVAYGELNKDILRFRLNYTVGKRYLKITDTISNIAMNFLLYSDPNPMETIPIADPSGKTVIQLGNDITEKVKNIFEKLKLS